MSITLRHRHLIWLVSAFFLLGGLLLYYLYSSRTIDYIPFLQNRIEQALDEMKAESEELAVHLMDEPVRFNEIPLETRYAHYAFRGGNLVFWTDHRYVPEYHELTGGKDLKRVSTLRHDILIQRRDLDDGIELYTVLQLEDRYKIDNSYVQSGINQELFGTSALTINNEGGEAVLIDGELLFSVTLKQQLFRDGYAVASQVFFWLFVFSVFAGVCLESWYFGWNRQEFKGLVLLVTGLIMWRALMLIIGFPGSVYQTELFSSVNFASSALNPSLGDLFLNLATATTLLLYIFLFIPGKLAGVHFGRFRLLGATLLSAMLIVCFHYQYIFMQTLYHNSQLSFDINESLQFDVLRITGFGVIILNAVISFLAFHILFSILIQVSGQRPIYLPLLLGSLIFAVINSILGQVFILSLTVAVVYALVLYHTGLFRELGKIRYRTFLYLFAGIFFTSILFTFTIHEFENDRENSRKIRFANEFLIENDNLAEFLLNEAIQGISEDVFIQSRLSSPFMSKDIIRSKIRQVHLSNYFDKYDVNIHVYNPNFQPYDIPSDIPPREVLSWRSGEYATNYENIYFINRLEDRASKRYLALAEVERRGITVGYVLIDMALKRIIPNNVYPELLVDNRFLEPFENADYSYAVMEDQRITYHAGEFNYQRSFEPGLLQNEELYSEGISRAGFDHLGVRAPQNKVVVISSKTHPGAHLVSNFSFFLLLIVSLTLIFSGIYALYYYYRNVDLTYTAKIQLYLNVAFFLPLIAVSLTTLSVINSSFRQDQQDEYFQKAQNIGINLSVELEQYLSRVSVDNDDLPDVLNFIGNVTGLDVNLFSVRGRLLATSQPQIYENDLLSSYINPKALAEIRDGGQNFQIIEESVGSLRYNNTFYGVRSYENGRLIGILSIPFFESANELEQNQIEVLTNVMNIFTVVFIVFLILSSLASDWLTFPLRFITQKLKKTTLTGFNEPLSWKADDEIGLMVSEYNRMLDNLEESKKALARSQKETAWREIAQQVAHEIKNPLTPMKLTLQHLARRFKGEEIHKPINSLIHQVDTLSDIASSFSSFAKLPIPEHERFELTSILRNTAQLYRENAEICLDIPDTPVYSMGDKKLMGRILSNIVLNAIQSYDNVKPGVEIILRKIKDDRALIEIRDRGRGIDSSIHSKIFIPNFTTKESGSGIGLAVAKHGVEHAGGKIWFETEEGTGTSFFIELPVVE